MLANARTDPPPAYAPTFRLISTPVGGHCLLMTGDLDLAARDRLRRALATLLPASDFQPLVLDLTQTTYLDCASLKVLLETRRQLGRKRAVSFRFAETGQPRRMLALLGLETEVGLPPSKISIRFASSPSNN